MSIRSDIPILYFLLGLALPFVTIGPEIGHMIWLSPSLFLGVIVLSFSLLSHGVNGRMLAAVALLMVLAATAIGRHPPMSFMVSLAALTLAICPLLVSNMSPLSVKRLGQGFIAGYLITLALLFLWIASQLVGMVAIYDDLSPFRAVRRNSHNFFVFYYRPQAGFAEPAHLAIYLAFAYAIFDHMTHRYSMALKLSCLIAIMLTGSFVGYFLIGSYLFVRFSAWFLRSLKSGAIISKRGFLLLSSVTFLAVVLLNEQIAQLLDTVSNRLSRTISVAQTGTMSGSEGSRMNTIRVLFDYWDDKGLPGFLFGEGYGNISHWLIATYSDVRWATVASGSVDSKAVALVLSSGVIGLIFYLVFLSTTFRHFVANRNTAIITLVLVSHFASGGLIMHWKWHLLFATLVFARAKAMSDTAPERQNTIWFAQPQWA